MARLRVGVGGYGRFVMSRRRLITSAVFAAAALSILLPQTLPARADDWANCPIQTGGPPAGQQAPSCSLTDIGNALQNTYNGFANGQCAAACDEPVTCALAVWATVLVGSMGGQSQGFCNAVSQASNWTGDAASDTQSAKNLLNQAGPSFASQFESYLNTLGSTVADIASIETPFTCACSIAAGLGQTFSDLGSCVESALCALANWASNLTGGWISSCTTNVSVDWGNCNQLGCAPAGSDGCPIICNSAKEPSASSPTVKSSGRASCPPPMSVARHGGAKQCTVGGVYQTLSCDCPAGTAARPIRAASAQYLRVRRYRARSRGADNPTGHVSAAADGQPCRERDRSQLRGSLPGDLRRRSRSARQRPVLPALSRLRPAAMLPPRGTRPAHRRLRQALSPGHRARSAPPDVRSADDGAQPNTPPRRPNGRGRRPAARPFRWRAGARRARPAGARRRRRHRLFRRAPAGPARPGGRPGGKDLHRSRRPFAGGFRSAGFARSGARATRPHAKAIFRQGEPDRPGVRRDAGLRQSTEHLRRRQFGLRTADRRGRSGRRTGPCPQGAGGRPVHARAVGAARPRAGRARSGKSTAPAARFRCLPMSATRGEKIPAPRSGGCVRSTIAIALRRRPRNRLHSPVRPRRRRARALRPRRDRARSDGDETRPVRSVASARCRQPAIR